MLLGEIITSYRYAHEMSQRQFALACGLSNGYISMLEKNKNPKTGLPIKPNIDQLVKIANTMGMTLTDLLQKADDMPVTIHDVKNMTRENDRDSLPAGASPVLDSLRIPLLGRVAAGRPLFDEGNVIGEVMVDPAMAAGDQNLYALKVKGDSMSPKILDGDTVIVREQPDAENGEIVIVTVNGEEGTCKKLQRYPDTLALVSLNPIYEPIVYTWEEVEQLPVRIVGKVIQSRHDF